MSFKNWLSTSNKRSLSKMNVENNNVPLYPTEYNNFANNGFYSDVNSQTLSPALKLQLKNSKAYAKSILKSTNPTAQSRKSYRNWKLIARFTGAFSRVLLTYGISESRSRDNVRVGSRNRPEKDSNATARIAIIGLAILAGIAAVFVLADADQKIEKTRKEARAIINAPINSHGNNDATKTAVSWIAMVHVRMLDRENASAKDLSLKAIGAIGGSSLLLVGAVFASTFAIQIGALGLAILGLKTIYDGIRDVSQKANRDDAHWLKTLTKTVLKENDRAEHLKDFLNAQNWEANNYMYARPPAFNPNWNN